MHRSARRRFPFLAAYALAALALPATAAAHHPPFVGGGGPDRVPAKVERVLGGTVTQLPNGLYRVRSKDGFSFTTHGPDFRDPGLILGRGSDLDPGDPEDDPVCATDYYQEILYGYPTTGANDLATHKASIQDQIQRNNALLNEESIASGGPPADFKVACAGDGTIKVTAFPVTPDLGATAASFDQIVSDAKAAGFGDGTTDTNVDYTIFYDGDGNAGACGVGYLYFDDRATVGNFNNNPGNEAGYAASFDGCWFGVTSIHENGHNQGAVQPNAPNSSGDGGHCDEIDDFMCYSDGGSDADYPITCTLSPGVLHYDCGWDTYFDSAPEAGEWLDTHWNIGHSRNRFIAFNAPDTTPPDTTIAGGPSGLTNDATPTWTFTSTEAGSFQCSVDGGGFVACSGPGASHTTATLTPGAHTFAVRALDTAIPTPNTDATPATRSITIDVTPPDTQIDSGPTGTITTSSTSISFSTAGPETSPTFECQLDGSGYGACTSPRVLVGLSDGAHAFDVRARDQAGNVDPAPASRDFVVDLPDGGGGGGDGGGAGVADLIAPETTITSGPKARLRVKRKANVRFGFASSEAGSTFGCVLDGGGLELCTSPKAYSGVRRGSHSFQVVAIDAAGNADATAATYAFKVKKKRRR